jgi:probable HAF family extracellular repeat protein
VIYGYASDQFGYHNFKYHAGKLQIINIPGVPYGFVNGTNPKGTALVGAVLPSAPTNSFLYENGTTQTIAYPGARATYAFGVNNAGQVSGFYYYDTGGPHGFLWTPPAHAETK